MKLSKRQLKKAYAYRDSAPGETINCEASGYADPAIATVWMSLFSCAVMFAYVIELVHACGRQIDGLSGHLTCTSNIKGETVRSICRRSGCSRVVIYGLYVQHVTRSLQHVTSAARVH